MLFYFFFAVHRRRQSQNKGAGLSVYSRGSLFWTMPLWVCSQSKNRYRYFQSTAVDIWSFGCLIYLLHTGRSLFHSDNVCSLSGGCCGFVYPPFSQEGNLERTDMLVLSAWLVSFLKKTSVPSLQLLFRPDMLKKTKLNEIKDEMARNLLQQIFSKVSSHFFSCETSVSFFFPSGPSCEASFVRQRVGSPLL